eukprot:COSAG05_NODE_16692_length_340_cov_2.066390_1_plen_26_part_10
MMEINNRLRHQLEDAAEAADTTPDGS